ncbi:response regulator transcription factor [Ferrovibrio sp.]|uniref:response regulator transcription factor n=1 Tax=Ferrovibrio sp. TaxID=1917215 RepID=UPI00311FCDF0
MSSGSVTILVVEDSKPVRMALGAALTAAGYGILEAPSGEDGLQQADGAGLILLDLGLPGISGFEVLETLRGTSQVPVIVLSGLDETDAKIRALDLGADDYVTKPFEPGELLARVRAALRRHAGNSQPDSVQVGPFEIDTVTGETRRGERPVRLSPMEARFVRMLAQRCGQPVGTKTLVQELWGADNPEQRQALRVLARKVRCKLEKDPDAPEILLTEPRLGYRLIDAEPAAAG